VRSFHLRLVAVAIAVAACTGDPVFTSGAGGSAAGGNPGAGGSGGEGAGASTGASAQGGDTTNTGAGPVGGAGAATNTGGSIGVGGQGGSVTTIPGCGDGIIDVAEGGECDDGNQIAADGCTACLVDCPANGYKDPITHHCYFTHENSPVSWSDAVDTCADSTPGTMLAILSTLEELSLVMGELETKDLWIGAHDMNVEGSFEWIDGEPWTFGDSGYPWAFNEPNNVGNGSPAHCVVLDDVTGPERLFDRFCDNSYTALCERSPLGQ